MAARAERPRAAQLRDAENEAEHREHAGKRGGPHHDLVPERLVDAQRREIEPVRDDAQPREQARARFVVSMLTSPVAGWT